MYIVLGIIGEKGLRYESFESYRSFSEGDTYDVAYRLTEAAVRDKTGNPGGGDAVIPSGGGSTIGGIVDSIKAYIGELFGEEQEEFPVGTPLSDEEYNNLYYKGIATLKGSSSTEKDPDEWVFPGLADITDWLSGFLIMPIRAAITGWANIVQIAVSEYINATAGGEVSGITEIMTNMSEYMKNAITLEKIVYNEIPLFDVNVFSGDNAGGETVAEDTLVATIRKLVAEWYYVFRLIAIIGLLIILIYIGIKMAISTIAEEKAKYKSLFVNWLVAFVIVFFMQYFMIFVMQINQVLIDIFKSIGKSLNLYETVRELTWNVKMTTGIIATALYVMLVYYMIKFVIMYFKRLFIVVILIILAPLIAAKYAIDKLSGNKDSQSLKTWGQEYVFNVLMQSIHALTYTIFTAVSVDIAKATTNTTSDVSYLFANIVLVIVFFRFMIESEKILKQMMKLVTGPGADFGDANTTSIRDLFGLTVLSQLTREMKPFYNILKIFGRGIAGNSIVQSVVSNVKMPFRKASNYIQDSYVFYNIERYKNSLKNLDNINFDNGNTGVNTSGSTYRNLGGKSNENIDIIGMGGKVDQLLRQDLINRKELIKDYIGTGANIVLGMGKTFIGLPIFLAESPLVGAELMLVGLRTVRVAIGKPITGYRKPEKMTSKWYKSPVVRGTYKTMATIMTGGTINIARQVYQRYKNENELRDMELSQVELLLRAQNVETSMSGNLSLIRNKYFKAYGKNANDIGNNLAKINEKELIQNIRDSQLSVPQAEIYNEVNEYKKKTGKDSLNNDDMNIIINNIRNRENKKIGTGEGGVILTNKTNDNMKAELISGIVNNVKERNIDYNSLELSKESLQNMSNNLKSRIEQLEGKENKTEQEIEQMNTLKLAYYVIKQKQVKNIDENEINELDEMKNNMQNIIRGSEENSKEDEIRTAVYNVLNDRKQKLETDMSKLGEDFTKTEEEAIKEPKETNNDLKDLRQKLKTRLDELNNKDIIDEKVLQEKEATQRAYNIVQNNIAVNEANKQIEKNTKDIAEKILNDNTEEYYRSQTNTNVNGNENKETGNTRNTAETMGSNSGKEYGGSAGYYNTSQANTNVNNNENVEAGNTRNAAGTMAGNNVKENVRSARDIAQTIINNNLNEKVNTRDISEQMTNNTGKGEERDAKETARTMGDNNRNREEGKTEGSNSRTQGIRKNRIEDIVNSIEKGNKNSISMDELDRKDEYKLNKAIIDSMSENVLENEIRKLDNKDLGRLIKNSTKIDGSIEKSKVSDKYKDIVRNAEKLRDINEESEEKYGKKIFSTKELIEGIKRGIRRKEKNESDEEV